MTAQEQCFLDPGFDPSGAKRAFLIGVYTFFTFLVHIFSTARCRDLQCKTAWHYHHNPMYRYSNRQNPSFCKQVHTVTADIFQNCCSRKPLKTMLQAVNLHSCQNCLLWTCHQPQLMSCHDSKSPISWFRSPQVLHHLFYCGCFGSYLFKLETEVFRDVLVNKLGFRTPALHF